MRKLIATGLLLFAASALCPAQTEYKRPTADANASVPSVCTGSVDQASSSMSAVYTGKSGMGPLGGGASLTATYAGSGESVYSARIFSAWQTAGHTYTSLTVTANAISSVVTGSATLYYSTNSGSSWSLLGSVGSSDLNYSATITGTALSSLQVLACASAAPATGAAATNTVYDIWTAGTYSTSSPQPGVQIISDLHVPKELPWLLTWAFPFDKDGV